MTDLATVIRYSFWVILLGSTITQSPWSFALAAFFLIYDRIGPEDTR